MVDTDVSRDDAPGSGGGGGTPHDVICKPADNRPIIPGIGCCGGVARPPMNVMS